MMTHSPIWFLFLMFGIVSTTVAKANKLPHIVFILIDDWGWANAGWHNNVTTAGQIEVQTPNMDQLVKQGIELNHHHAFKFCSPTRSALQSGRNPIHVNVQNVAPTYHNPEDPVSGFSAIPRNMTGMAQHMKKAGYFTAAVGKWDAGMATLEHTPHGRGYQRSLIYFHHANDYWTYGAGNCKPTQQEKNYLLEYDSSLSPNMGVSMDICPSSFTILNNTGICHGESKSFRHYTVERCCAECAGRPNCTGWTFQAAPQNPNNVCFICNVTNGRSPAKGRTTGCKGEAACNPQGTIDLWSDLGPAKKKKNNNSPPGCRAENGKPWPSNQTIKKLGCVYEDALFEQEVLDIIHTLDASSTPLFLFWAPHIVHGPAQVPEGMYDTLNFITKDSPKGAARQNYLARVKYIDGSIGRMVSALHEKNMFNNTLIVVSSDNGGPIGDANNWPLKGGKHSNFQGGTRVNAFVSGGFVPVTKRGTRVDDLIAVWDWYATFAGIAGVDPTDHAAAKANLPPIDSINQWPFLSGQTSIAPRTDVYLGSCTAADNSSDVFCQTTGFDQTIVSGVVSWLEVKVGEVPASRQLWKLLVGNIQLALWEGPKFPNGTAHKNPVEHCGVPPHNGTGCLYNLSKDPTEHVNLADDPSYSSILHQLLEKIKTQNATTFSPHRGSISPDACKAANENGGFWGPFVQ